MNDRYKLREVIPNTSQLRRFYGFMDPAGLVTGGKIMPRWFRDGVSFWYAQGAPHATAICRVDGNSGTVATLLDVSKIRKSLSDLLRRDIPYRGLTFDSLIDVGDNQYAFHFEGRQYVIRANDHAIRPADGEGGLSSETRSLLRLFGIEPTTRQSVRSYLRPMWLAGSSLVSETGSPDGRWYASVTEGNILLRSPVDDRAIRLTTDGTTEFAWDIESPRDTLVAGMESGERFLNPWSPDSNRLFAIKYDRRAVPDLPYVRYLKPEEELCSIKMQRAGGALDIPYPHSIDILSKRQRRFELGETEDQFFTLVGWLPNGSEVLFTRHSRDFKRVDVLAGDPISGSVRTVLSEEAGTFVALQHDVIYHGNNHLTILPDGSGLIWRSARSGWNHLYLYGIDGTLLQALTGGEFPVIDVSAVDQESGWVYFTAHHDQKRPYDTHLCRVSLGGDSFQRLTERDGQNSIFMSPSKSAFVVINSRPDREFRTDFYACDGRRLATVQQAEVAALKEISQVASEEFTVKAADGKTELWGVMHKPADFNPMQSYPIVDHVYGGPQVAMVTRHFGFDDDIQKKLDRALAQLGCIVISLDARGTPERSKAFQDVVYQNWGRHEIPDHVAALSQLAARHSYIDLDRVGIWGHSWGGYFTIRALAQAPELFRVGVASAPGTDPYSAILYEPYLDLPTRARAGYEYATLYPWAEKIRGSLMMIVGTNDPFIYSNVINMTHHLIESGVDHELVVLPDGYHAYLGGKDEEYFVHKLIKHFAVNLRFSHRSRAPVMARHAANISS